MKHYTYRTIIEPDGKFFHGYVPALQGCHTFGKTLEETKKYLREAISTYLQSLIDDDKKIAEVYEYNFLKRLSLSKDILQN